MALSGLRRRVLRALGMRLRAWSVAALTRAGDELPAPPAPPAADMPARSGPPAHWLARVRPSGPPAHWLARVRQAQAELGGTAQFDGAAAPQAPAPAPNASTPEVTTGSASLPLSQSQAMLSSTPQRAAPGRAAARLPLRLSPATPRTPQESLPETSPPEKTRAPVRPPEAPPSKERRSSAALPEVPRPARRQAEENAAAGLQPARIPVREATPEESPVPHDMRAALPAAVAKRSHLPEPTTALAGEARTGRSSRAAPVALRVQAAAARERASVPAPDAGSVDDVVTARPDSRAEAGVDKALPALALAREVSEVAGRPALAIERAIISRGEPSPRAEESRPALRGESPAPEAPHLERRPPRAASIASQRKPARQAPAGRWPKLPDEGRLPETDDPLESLRVTARLERLDREQRGR